MYTKYSWLFLSIIISIITTIIAGELEGVTVAQEIQNTTPENISLTADSVTGFFDTYWRLLTFQVTGIPMLLTLFFMMLNIIIGFIFVEGILIPTLQAIIPFT